MKSLIVLLIILTTVVLGGVGITFNAMRFPFTVDEKSVTLDILNFGLRASFWIFDVGAFTPFYAMVSAEGASVGTSLPPFLVYFIYADVRSPGMVYAKAGALTALTVVEEVKLAEGFAGILGGGLKIGNVFAEISVVFDLEKVSETLGKLFLLDVGVKF